MNPEQQRIAIAEACGLTILSDGITHHLTPCGKKTAHDPEGCLLKKCPDYLNDLNAMHEAEESLLLKKQMLYQGMIGKVTGNKCPALFGQIHATAAQRAEAFLRTIGKWVES